MLYDGDPFEYTSHVTAGLVDREDKLPAAVTAPLGL